MKQNIDLDSNEKILDSIPIKPFTILTVTNKRIIGKSIIPIGFNRFEGEIFYENIISIDYLPGRKYFIVPRMKIEYRKDDGESSEITINFHGPNATYAGFDSDKVYKLILAQMQ